MAMLLLFFNIPGPLCRVSPRPGRRISVLPCTPAHFNVEKDFWLVPGLSIAMAMTTCLFKRAPSVVLRERVQPEPSSDNANLDPPSKPHRRVFFQVDNMIMPTPHIQFGCIVLLGLTCWQYFLKARNRKAGIMEDASGMRSFFRTMMIRWIFEDKYLL